jgi:hypothetical protein
MLDSPRTMGDTAMDFFDWFFPEQAQASHLRQLADAQSRVRLSGSDDSDTIENLVRENRELRLYLTAITQLLVEKGLLRPEEVQAKVMAMLPPLPPAPKVVDDNPFTDLGR